jgi:hypothetical protein
MAAVAAGPKVVEIQPQIRSLPDRNLMVRMQVAFSLAETFPQFCQNLLHGRGTQIELPEIFHYVRLPAAVDTPPFVADEAENPQPPMVGVIAAGCRSPSPLIVLPLRFPFVLRAPGYPVAENSASRRVAGTFGQVRHRDSCRRRFENRVAAVGRQALPVLLHVARHAGDWHYSAYSYPW